MKFRPWVKFALAAIVSFSPVYLIGERLRALSTKSEPEPPLNSWVLESTSEPDVKIIGAFILPESITDPIRFIGNVFDTVTQEIKYSDRPHSTDWPPCDDAHEGYGATFDIPLHSLWQCHGGLWRRMETR